MGKTSVYIPDELIEQIKVLGEDLNISAIVQETLRQRLEEQTHYCSRCGQSLQYRRQAEETD